MKKYTAQEKREFKKTFTNQKQQIKMETNLSVSSANWIRQQKNDFFSNKAKFDGYLSRAAYKILSIEKKYNLIKKSKNIADLGAAPGSWLQAIERNFNINGKKFTAIDLLELKFIPSDKMKIKTFQGDFLDIDMQNKMIEAAGEKFCLIMSDIAANATGNKSQDRMKSETINISIVDFAISNLKENGSLILKCLMGSDLEIFKYGKKYFEKIERFKPDASKQDSTEIYLVCLKKISS